MNAFDQAEELLNEIDEHQGNYDYENILPVAARLRALMKNHRVEFFHIYFNGNLSAVEDFTKDLIAPADESMWSWFYAHNYLRDHLFRARYGLALMKNALTNRNSEK